MTNETPNGRESIPEIDRAAPVWSAREIEISAPVEVVWNVLARIPDWPVWNPDVRSVAVDGPVGEGMTFRWRAGPSTIKSTIRYVEPLRGIAWTGKTMGIDAIHVWRFESREGRTLVRTEESYSGFVSRIFRRYLQRVLDQALANGLKYLKAESELRVGPRSR